MFESNKKRSNFSSDSATLGISESKKVLVLPLTLKGQGGVILTPLRFFLDNSKTS